jgi:hypothetical protein
MKRIGVMLAVVLLLMLGLNSHLVAKHDSPPSNATVLRCSLTGSTYTVTAISESSGAPPVALSSSCGQALADLTNAGFGLTNTQLEQSTMSLVYTLIGSSDSN